MSGHNRNALAGRYKCSVCQKGYMMEWARNNHQKLYLQRVEAEKRKENKK